MFLHVSNSMASDYKYKYTSFNVLVLYFSIEQFRNSEFFLIISKFVVNLNVTRVNQYLNRNKYPGRYHFYDLC